MILAIVHRSAVTPSACCAPPGLKRKPVITSSNTRITLRLRVASRSAARKPAGSGTCPHDAPEGSTITAAMSSRASSSSTVGATSSVGIRIVDSTLPRSTPAGRVPSKCELLPAATWSCQPWKWPRKRTTLSLPEKARARRSARCVASVPEAVKRTRSAPGTIAFTSSAQRSSSSCEAPKCVPRAAWR